MDLQEMRRRLGHLEWGEHGLTRHELRDAWPEFPQEVYLRLPDSKRYTSVDDVLHEAGHSFARAEGEFIAADDETPTDGAVADGGPPAWGPDPIINASGGVNEGGSRPLAEG